MVYDISRNYIGDMHWREDEVLQDGDEFELDRGVLIQVGESTGSMEQDLTGLFEKKKKAPEVAVQEEVSPQPVAVPTARPKAAHPSQLRPKTLNALLGTPKGRIGRAALPTKSPHELRTESENLSWDLDRPAKRQRIDPRLERRAQKSNVVPQQELSSFQYPHEGMTRCVVGGGFDKSSEGNSMPTNVRNSNFSPAVDPVSMLPPSHGPTDQKDVSDETPPRILEPLSKKSCSGSSKSAARQKRRSDQDLQVLPRVRKVAKRPGHELDRCYATITKPIEIASDEDATPTNEPRKQRGKLQLASRKPRKKLMYRDILPQESSTVGHSSDYAPMLDRRSSNQHTLSRSRNPKIGLMTEFHNQEQDQLKARLNRHNAKEIQRDNEREQFCGDPPEDLFLSQEPIDATSAKHHRTTEKSLGGMSNDPPMTDSRRRHTEPVLSSTRHSPSQETLQEVIPRPPSSVHRTAMTLARMDEILFPHPQIRTSDPVQNKDTLTEIVPQELCPSSVLNTPSETVSLPSVPKDQRSSSPAFQIQAHIPSSKDLPREDISKRSRSNADPLSAFAKAVQPKVQAAKQRTVVSPPSDSRLLSTVPAPPLAPHNHVSAPSPPNDQRASPPGLRPHPQIHSNESPPPQPREALVSPLPNAEPNPPLAISKPTAADPAPKPKPTKKPTFTKPTARIPTPDLPDAETVEIPSSQPSTSPPPSPPKRKPNPLLPAFTKVIPTTKPRVPLKKSTSDTSTMQPLFTLPVPNGKGKEKVLSEEDTGQKNDEGAGLWNKEAWDLFGCGRDGVECTYEEFKRKEGFL